MTRGIDSETRDWIRNDSDELAAKAGCRFDGERGQYVIDWWRQYLRLYEGDAWAGQPFEARDWQYDCTMRMFGWIKHSARWSEIYGREIWLRRFTQAIVMVPKKNKKSPTLSAYGLYLLCGDGERGQKVFFGARDGKQARDIAGKHAVEMLKQSPDLMAECEINKVLCRITHVPTTSILEPISSSDARSQESKEGLNGSVLIDEMHVVDGRFMNRVSRAGISRAQPFQIEVSTAGNNPDGYGKARRDYGLDVRDGKVTDQRLFFEEYAAPQDLSDDELATDPVKFGKLSNPAWGHTIDEEEYLSDYNASKRSLSDLATFKMYRLNIWQHSSNPWLNGADWDACAGAFTAGELQGKQAWVGLDLSRTRDMTAAVVCIRDEDLFYFLPYFWLPEAYARKINHLVPILQWSDKGFVELTPGDVVDYEYVEQRLGEICNQFKVQALLYDPYLATELTERVSNATGVACHEFRQSMTAFAAPTAEFERLCIAHKLRHPNNEVFNWQARNATVKPDANNNKRPVKPSDHRKIDGIVAAIMALALANVPVKRSVYEERGPIVV